MINKNVYLSFFIRETLTKFIEKMLVVTSANYNCPYSDMLTPRINVIFPKLIK